LNASARAKFMLLSGQLAALGIAVNQLIAKSQSRAELEASISLSIHQVAEHADEEDSLDRRMMAKGLREQLILMVGLTADGKDDAFPH
jgi:hypothetical protein